MRETILKRDDYSFVIDYDLLLDEYKKNNYSNKGKQIDLKYFLKQDKLFYKNRKFIKYFHL